MLQQDRPSNAAYGGVSSSLRLLSNGPQPFSKKCEKDSNFNFLGDDNETLGGDENRNQVRPPPRSLVPLGRELPTPQHHVGVPLGPLSPLSRLPCWSPLEPLPEVESGDDAGGRVPPDGAEEGGIDEEMRRPSDMEKAKEELEDSREYGSKGGVEEEEEEDEDEEGLQWGDSDEDFAFSSHSSSASSLVDGGEAGLGNLPSVWDRLCIGGPPNAEQYHASLGPQGAESFRGSLDRMEPGEGEEEEEEEEGSSDSEWDGGGGGSGLCGGDEVLEALWSAQDRQRFKEQEMQKHQLQLTMYRRLALIRWVRTLQSRVQDQQNRLQTSFDVILTHRKELLRLGAAASH